jgi:hypothetical protein
MPSDAVDCMLAIYTLPLGFITNQYPVSPPYAHSSSILLSGSEPRGLENSLLWRMDQKRMALCHITMLRCQPSTAQHPTEALVLDMAFPKSSLDTMILHTTVPTLHKQDTDTRQDTSRWKYEDNQYSWDRPTGEQEKS